jgi:glycolate oxidase
VTADRIAAGLAAHVPRERILADAVRTETYGYDASFATRLQRHRPDVVVRATNTEEVAAVVTWCHEHGVPIAPRGAATAQSGGPVAVRGGVCLDLSPMRRIVELLPDDLQVVCEPGVIHADLNRALAKHQLFFAPDPGSSAMCTIGGMVANNSSGMRAVKYGQTKHHVLGLEVVLPDGTVITTGGVGSHALKSVSGYDLTSLFVGSEGTLGVITRARLKALPLPAKRGLCLAAFANVAAAGEAVGHVFRSGILPSAIEIFDARSIEAIRQHRPDVVLPDAAALLIFEVEGDEAAVRSAMSAVVEVVGRFAEHLDWADDPQRMDDLWAARRTVGAAVARVRDGFTRVYGGEDICVPITALPEALASIHALGDRHGIHVAIYGHVGDGNVHAAPIIDMRDEAQVETAKALIEEIHELALRLRGTTTGEHGVGIVRAAYMQREHGASLALMQLLKRTLDPRGLMNPGKMALDPSDARGPYDPPRPFTLKE